MVETRWPIASNDCAARRLTKAMTPSKEPLSVAKMPETHILEWAEKGGVPTPVGCATDFIDRVAGA